MICVSSGRTKVVAFFSFLTSSSSVIVAGADFIPSMKTPSSRCLCILASVSPCFLPIPSLLHKQRNGLFTNPHIYISGPPYYSSEFIPAYPVTDLTFALEFS